MFKKSIIFRDLNQADSVWSYIYIKNRAHILILDDKKISAFLTKKQLTGLMELMQGTLFSNF